MDKRTQFLTDVLDIAAQVHAEAGLAVGLTHADRAQFGLKFGEPAYGLEHPDTCDDYTATKVVLVTLDTVRKGLQRLNAKGGERLLAEHRRSDMVAASRTNGDAGSGWDDGCTCAAVIEIGKFGEVVYT